MRTIRGVLTALPTPLRDEVIDMPAFRRFVAYQLEQGIDGLVVCGTTGEAATLVRDERAALIRATVELAAGSVPVVVGVGTNATASTLTEAARAEALGADALMVVTPYYNRPCQDGLRLHFGAVAAGTALPIVLYNVPGRTGVYLQPETAACIARDHANVVAIKEARSTPRRWQAHVDLGALDLLCGEDEGLVAARQAGATGWVGVLPNLAPGMSGDLFRAAAPEPEGDCERLGQLRSQVAPFFELLALGGNPAPVKAGLAAQGWMTPEVRLPLISVKPPAELTEQMYRHAAGLKSKAGSPL
jgi:4-hydroxy-tetrahydrodipicolinate synthase